MRNSLVFLEDKELYNKIKKEKIDFLKNHKQELIDEVVLNIKSNKFTDNEINNEIDKQNPLFIIKFSKTDSELKELNNELNKYDNIEQLHIKVIQKEILAKSIFKFVECNEYTKYLPYIIFDIANFIEGETYHLSLINS